MAQISTTKCNVCGEKIGKEFCYECQHFLCQSCRAWHDKFQKRHTFTESHNVDRLALTKKHTCEKHHEDFVHYCANCESLICTSCVTTDHQGHSLTSISVVVSEARELMEVSADKIEKKIKTLADLIKSLKVTQVKQIENECEHFSAEVIESCKDIASIVQSIKNIEITRASDFLILCKEEIENATARLETINNEHISVNTKLQQVLRLKHDIAFFLNHKTLTKEVEGLDDIPQIDEPNKLGKFNKEEFTKSVVEQIHSRLKTTLNKDTSDISGDNSKDRADQSELIRSLESTRQTQEKDLLALKNSYDDMLQKYEAEVTKNEDIRERAEKQIRDLRKRAQDDREDRERQFRRQIKDREEEIRDLKDSNRPNNPGIAHFSDANRSIKVAKLYGSVYDKEWTDALECLTHQGTDEEAGVRFLLEIMKHIYSYCTKAKEQMMQELQGCLSNPVSRGTYTYVGMSSPVDKQIRQMLDSCVKMKVKTAIPTLYQSYSQMKPSSKPRYVDRVPEYVNKCIEICWLMNTQSPSLIFAEPLQSGQIIDKDQYKEYTKQGDIVSFVIWLPLLKEQDGTVLSKGVVQPVAQSKSEQRRSSKSESVKSRSHRATGDKRFKEVVDEVSRDQRDYANERSKTIGGTRPESGKNTSLVIDPSDVFPVGGHNYTLHNGKLYKQNHAGEWRFTNQLGES